MSNIMTNEEKIIKSLEMLSHLLEEVAYQTHLVLGQLRMNNQNSYFKYKSEYLNEIKPNQSPSGK